MTREDCLLKLLALEPESRWNIAAITGWPPGESDEVLDRLLAQRRVTYGLGPYRTGGIRLYYPAPAQQPSRIVRLARIADEERRIRELLTRRRPKTINHDED